MYAAFASMSMDAMDAVALNRDEDCMMLRRGAQQSLRCDLEALDEEKFARRLGRLAVWGHLWHGHCNFSIHTPLYPAGPTMAQI